MLKKNRAFKSQDRSVRKQIIQDTASRVFLRKGYETATMDNIAAELGITKAALYYYFSSKEDLLAAIYMQAIQVSLDGAREIEKLDLPAPEKMRRLIIRHVKDTIIGNVSAVSVFLAEENQLSPENQRKIRQGKKAYNNIFEDLLSKGIQEGDFRQADARFGANAMLGMCNSLHRWYSSKDSPGGPEEIARKFIALLETGYVSTGISIDEEPCCDTRENAVGSSDWRRELKQEQKRHQKAVEAIMEKHQSS